MGGNCFSTEAGAETPILVDPHLRPFPQPEIGNNMASAAAPVVIHATAKHTATVFFLHGLGDTGHGWAQAFAMINKSPHVKYVCPTAPTIPVTLNGGFRMPSWFDIRSLSVDAAEDVDGIKTAAKNVHTWLDEEVKAGIPSNRIMIGGFSQGGALAFYSTFMYTRPLAGVIGLSCWLPIASEIPPKDNQANNQIPMLQCHGDADPLVIPAIGAMSSALLQKINPANHKFKMYSGMGHSSCDEEMNDVKLFIERNLPPV